jgi:cytochrome c-type biogenesis protein CcmH/NrfG
MPLMWNTLIAQGVLLVRVVLLCVYLLLVWEQMQAWQEEVERARQSQREAEAKISSLEVTLISSPN